MVKKQKRKPTAKRKKPVKPTANHFNWEKMELESLNPLFQRQFVVGDNVMLARILLKKGCVVPLHSHHNEQISFVLEGALKFIIDGREVVVRSGEVLTIPPYVPHEVETLVDSVTMDIFSPPRADWISKSDQYLREKSTKKTKVPAIVGR